MGFLRVLSMVLMAMSWSLAGCSRSASDRVKEDGKRTVGVTFETLQTEYWVAGFDAIKSELAKRDIEVLEAIADSDPTRQRQQVRNFITRKVDGIIMVPKDAKSCISAIRDANEAGIPIVLFNRPAGESDAKHRTRSSSLSLKAVGGQETKFAKL